MPLSAKLFWTLIEKKDYRKLQNSFYTFHITGKMRKEKIADELEPAVMKKRSKREGEGSGMFNLCGVQQVVKS